MPLTSNKSITSDFPFEKSGAYSPIISSSGATLLIRPLSINIAYPGSKTRFSLSDMDIPESGLETSPESKLASSPMLNNRSPMTPDRRDA